MKRTWSALLLAVATLIVAGPATGDPGSDKTRIDSKIDQLSAQATQKDHQAGVLTDELSAATGRVRALDGAVAAQTARLDELDRQLGAARTKLGHLDSTIRRQTAKLAVAGRTYRVSVGRLEQRVHDLYVSDNPDLMAVVLGTESFTDLLDNVELLRHIGRQDRQIVKQVAGARDAIADARARTQAARAEVASLARAIGDHAAEQRGVVARLAENRDALREAEAAKRATLNGIRGDRQELLAEIEDLQKQSSALAATIRSSQAAAQTASATTVTPSGSGMLRWPVSGPVTSPFGMRWGRMHEGIDIGVPSGTPVAAAGTGTVIYAGWMEGYGNLVAIDHGGGLATAYGHNTSVTVSVGQQVTAGTIIAYSGSTGHSTGPHVHFEVRVNGTPVDPLGYL